MAKLTLASSQSSSIRYILTKISSNDLSYTHTQTHPYKSERLHPYTYNYNNVIVINKELTGQEESNFFQCFSYLLFNYFLLIFEDSTKNIFEWKVMSSSTCLHHTYHDLVSFLLLVYVGNKILIVNIVIGPKTIYKNKT